MARPSLSNDIADAVLVDWRMGKLSQGDIAAAHKISKGVVNKLCKGIRQDGLEIVTA